MQEHATASLSDLILSRIQTDFPLVERPYQALAEEFSCTEEEALNAVNALREEGIARRIGATFEPSKLGYTSTLAAISVSDEEVERAAEIINAYPEITHNYLRNNAFNIWFTVIAPGKERIQEILDEVAEKVGCEPALNLPAIHLFKIRVNFDVAGLGDTSYKQRTVKPAEVVAPNYSDVDIALIRAIQGSIDKTARPFDSLAQEVGLDVDGVLERLNTWKSEGIIRRFGAVVRHRKIGATANAMTVWDIPDEKAIEAGEIMARFTAVSHCYERPRNPRWNANVYTMIHAPQPEDCYNHARAIRSALAEANIVVNEPELLFSSREFKKRSMRYFSER